MAKQLKVAHFARFGPNQCGQYHTVKDLMYGERQHGIDAQFIDSYMDGDKQHCGEIKSDGWLTTVSSDWVKEADVLVLHSFIPKKFKETRKPIISMLHGRPENTYLLESYEKLGTWSSYFTRSKDPQYKVYVTFWPELLPIYQRMIPKEKLFCIPAPVNLEDFSPEGPKFDFGKYSGTPNIIVTDMWREDVTPFNTVMAGALFRERYCPTAKLHLFGMQGVKKNHNKVLLLNLQKDGVLGRVGGIIKNIADVYRAGDILITPHIIATRVIREALATGLPIVAGEGCRYTEFVGNPRNIEGFAKEINRCWKAKHDREAIRKDAVSCFDPKDSAGSFLSILQNLTKPKIRKLDVGCADFKKEGYIGMDIRKVKGVDIVHNALDFPWPFKDNSLDEVRMSHLYEHIEPKYRVDLIDEAWRVLSPKGKLVLICPSENTIRAANHPAHYNCPNGRTFTFFDPDENPYFNHNEGKPWKLLLNKQNRNGDLLVKMEPRK